MSKTTSVRTGVLLIWLTCAVGGVAQAVQAAPLPGCTAPVPGILSCTYVLKAFNGQALPQVLPNTVQYEKRVMQLISGKLRLSTTPAALKSGDGTYSLEWTWLDRDKNLKNTANDVGDYIIDASGHLTLTSLGKTVYKGLLSKGKFALKGVPLVTENFSGKVALDFAVK